MEAPEGCPPEIYEIMRQVKFINCLISLYLCKADLECCANISHCET